MSTPNADPPAFDPPTFDLLVFDQLRCGYGDTVVLREVSGHIGGQIGGQIGNPIPAQHRRGQVLAVVGRNGVGKSTLLKSLAGALPLLGGTLRWRGQPLHHTPLHQRLVQGLAWMPQDDTVFGDLTVADNLWLHVHDRRARPHRYAALLAQFPLLATRFKQRAGSLSGGERKLLGFVRTLGLHADLTLLDEPTEGVQPENIARMAACLNQRKADGASFMVVEQNLEFIHAVADDILVLDQGRVVRQGAYSELGRAQIEAHLVL